MSAKIQYAYLASEGFQDQLVNELKGIQSQHGRLILTDRLPVQPPLMGAELLAQSHLDTHTVHFGRGPTAQIPSKKLEPVLLSLTSTGPTDSGPTSFCLRKTATFSNTAPSVSSRVMDSSGSRDSFLAASDCSSSFPNGAIQFVEDKTHPPNRAYLKLWEALTTVQDYPNSDQFCIDVGASPGGWTWVLAKLGAEVLSIDRSLLDERISKMPGVSFQKGDAFSLSPEKFKESRDQTDWLFSDLVCYPEKLFDWVMMWVESGICHNFICTLKFQGDSDYQIAQKFAAIPHSQVLHLFHNKHELTWIKMKAWEPIPE